MKRNVAQKVARRKRYVWQDFSVPGIIGLFEDWIPTLSLAPMRYVMNSRTDFRRSVMAALTTAGDFCRRFNADDLDSLTSAIHQA